MNYVPEPGRAVALLNIGASIMNINVVKDGTSSFNRDIAVGATRHPDAIERDLDLPPAGGKPKRGEQAQDRTRC